MLICVLHLLIFVFGFGFAAEKSRRQEVMLLTSLISLGVISLNLSMSSFGQCKIGVLTMRLKL